MRGFEQARDLFALKQAGGAAADEDGPDLAAAGAAGPECELVQGGVEPAGGEVFEAGVGVEVAVGALDRAEGDVDVERERQRWCRGLGHSTIVWPASRAELPAGSARDTLGEGRFKGG